MSVPVNPHKTPSGNPSRFEYICDKCGKSFGQRGKLTKHLSAKTPCYERRDLAWMKTQIKSGRIGELLTEFDSYEKTLLSKIASLNKDSSLEELDAIRKSIMTIKRKKDNIISYTRILLSEEKISNEINGELEGLNTRIDKLVGKYKLLLLV